MPLGKLQERPLEAHSFVDPNGQFSIGPLEPGHYLVRAIARGHAASKALSVEVRQAETAQADFLLAMGARLTGKVLDAQSRSPISGARVEGEGPNIDIGVPIQIEAATTTGTDGTFELRGLAAGPQSVGAGAQGYNSRILSGLQLVDGQTLGPVEIPLTPLSDADAEPKQEFTGIGAVVAPEGDVLIVGRVYEGGGAFAAGLVTGDRILAIDGQTTASMGSLDATVQHLRGPPGTTVILTVRRSDGQESQITVLRKLLKL